MTAGGGHYETLGVRPDATAAEIRDAYRALARQHHPDRGPVDPGAMAAINEAYRVLGDPARRAVYDAAARSTGSAAGPGHAGATSTTGVRAPTAPPPQPLPEPKIPWKLMIGMFILGATVVLVGAALYRPKEPAPPDNLLEPGSCVMIEANGDAREINCTGAPGELVVAALVGMDERCPTGHAGYRDRQGRGLACVAPPREPTVASAPATGSVP
jgi:molecular chaperone DnaJ